MYPVGDEEVNLCFKNNVKDENYTTIGNLCHPYVSHCISMKYAFVQQRTSEINTRASVTR